MKINLVIFDMDGVLVDACEWHRIALNQALKKISNYEISLEDHLKEYNGIPTKIKLQKLLSKNLIKEKDIQSIEKLKQKLTIEIIESNASPREEKINLFTFLKNKNIKIACYTNSIKKTAELMLNKSGLLNKIDYLVSNEDIKAPKPDPEGYLLAIDYFKINKENIIIVEDSPVGIKAALATGCKVIKIKSIEQVTIDLFKDFE